MISNLVKAKNTLLQTLPTHLPQITSLRKHLKPARAKYVAAIVVDLLCIGLIVGSNMDERKPFLPALIAASSRPGSTSSSVDSQVFGIGGYDLFAFAPGWSTKKMNQLQLPKNASTLAYFDLPVNEDGTIYRDNFGYTSFNNANDIFHQAHVEGKKVVVTLTPMDNSTIRSILDSSVHQETLIAEAVNEVQSAGIDGVNINFEYSGVSGADYQAKFTNFLQKFRSELRAVVPGSLLTVSLGSYAVENPMYNLGSIAEVTDKVFLVAYDYAVSENVNGAPAAPLHGYNDFEYWSKVTNTAGEFLKHVPSHKLTIETAWYGNGENYPFYQDKEINDDFTNDNSLTLPLTSDQTEAIISGVPGSAKASARENLPYIAQALKGEGILNVNVLAYAMATIEHETAGTFAPIEEIKGRRSARRLGYEGGTDYLGRGFIQLTHLRNYKKYGQRIGLGDDLVKNPSLALEGEVSAKILAAFFKDNGVARRASSGNFVSARTPVNPDSHGYSIAQLAWKYVF